MDFMPVPDRSMNFAADDGSSATINSWPTDSAGAWPIDSAAAEMFAGLAA